MISIIAELKHEHEVAVALLEMIEGMQRRIKHWNAMSVPPWSRVVPGMHRLAEKRRDICKSGLARLWDYYHKHVSKITLGEVAKT